MKKQFVLMAGPCVIESAECLDEIAAKMKTISEKLNIEYYFKASWDKANRTTAEKYRGPGLEKGLQMLQDIKSKYNLPIITDFHEPWQAEEVKKVADIIQVPAYLSRQTDMIKAAAETNLPVQIKKAQFMSPDDMRNVVEKIKYYKNAETIYLCERGICFGYNNMVVDMIGLAKMKEFGNAVIFDATHSVQLPGAGQNQSTSGQSKYVESLALAACAVNVDGLFMEVHPEPEKALCDAACMVKLDDIEGILKKAVAIHTLLGEDIC